MKPLGILVRSLQLLVTAALVAGCGPLAIGAGIAELVSEDPDPVHVPAAVYLSPPPAPLSSNNTPVFVIQFESPPGEFEAVLRTRDVNDDYRETETFSKGSWKENSPVEFEITFPVDDGEHQFYVKRVVYLGGGTPIERPDPPEEIDGLPPIITFEVDTQAPPEPEVRLEGTTSGSISIAWEPVADPGTNRPVTYIVSARFSNQPSGPTHTVAGNVDKRGFTGDSSLADVEGFYEGQALRFITDDPDVPAVLKGQSRIITDYKGAARTFVFDSGFSVVPEVGNTFEIIGKGETIDRNVGSVTTHTFAVDACRTYEVSVVAIDAVPLVTLEDGSVFWPNKSAPVELTCTTPCGGTADFVEQPLRTALGVVDDFTKPVGIVTGRFDTDTDLDIAVLDAGAGKVRVFLRDSANAEGVLTYTEAGAHGIGSTATVIRAADLNRDGITDLVVGFEGPTDGIDVLLGQGDGSFAANTPPGVSVQVHGLAVLDLNRDGNPDVVVAGTPTAPVDEPVALLEGKGDGTFNAPIRLALPTDDAASSVAVADANNDDLVDLIVSNASTAELTIFPADPDETNNFAAPVVVALGSTPGAVAAGDFDAERIADLAVLAPNEGQDAGALRILLGEDAMIKKLGTVTYRVDGVVDADAITGTVNASRNPVSTVEPNSAVVDFSRRQSTVVTTQGTVSVPDTAVGTVAAPHTSDVDIAASTVTTDDGTVTLDMSTVDITVVAATDPQPGGLPNGVIVGTAAAGSTALSDQTDFYDGMVATFPSGDSYEITGYTFSAGTGTFTLAVGGSSLPTPPVSFNVEAKDRFDAAAAGLSTADDFYNGMVLRFDGSTANSGVSREITDYEVEPVASGSGTNRFTFTFASGFPNTPVASNAFRIVAKDRFDAAAASGTTLSDTNDFYKGMLVRFAASGTANNGISREISAYTVTANGTGTRRTFEFTSGFPAVPENTNSFEIVAKDRFDAGALTGGPAFSDVDDFYKGMLVRFAASGTANNGISREISAYTVTANGTGTRRTFELTSGFPAVPEDPNSFEIVAKDRFDADAGGLSPTSDAYKGMLLRFDSGTANGDVSREISSYTVDGSRRTFEFVTAFPNVPENGNTFVIAGENIFRHDPNDATGSALTIPSDLTDRWFVRFQNDTATSALQGESQKVVAYDAALATFKFANNFSAIPVATPTADTFEIVSHTEFIPTAPFTLPTVSAGGTLKVRFLSGALEGEVRNVAATSTDTLIVVTEPLSAPPAAGDTFEIIDTRAFSVDVTGFAGPFPGLAEAQPQTVRFLSGGVASSEFEVEAYASTTGTFTLLNDATTTTEFAKPPSHGDALVVVDVSGSNPRDTLYFDGDLYLSEDVDFNGRTIQFTSGGPTTTGTTPTTFDIVSYDASERRFQIQDPATTPEDFTASVAHDDEFMIESDTTFEGALLDPYLSDEDHVYDGMEIQFTGDTLTAALQNDIATIDSYDGDTHTFVVTAPLDAPPTGGDDFRILRTDRFSGGTTLSTDDDFYNGRSVEFVSGSNAGGMPRDVTDYDGTTRTFDFDSAFAFAPRGGEGFVVLPSATRFEGDAGLSATDDVFNDRPLVFLADSANPRSIQDYFGSTRTFVIASGFTAPNDTDAFAILAKDQFDGDDTLSDVDGFFRGGSVRFISASAPALIDDGVQQISKYVGSDRTFIFTTPFSTEPREGDQFVAELENTTDGRGDLTFALVQTFTTGDEPRSLILGDFESNHILDVVVANTGATTDNLAVFLGKGSGGHGIGAFHDPINLTARHWTDVAANDGSPQSVITADLNGDGIADLVTANVGATGAGSVSLFIGRGANGEADATGLFTKDDVLDLTCVNHPFDLLAEDFNADGVPDLGVLLNPTSDKDLSEDERPQVAVYLGKGLAGEREFEAPNVVSLPRTFGDDSDPVIGRAESFTAGDFTQDGVLDIVVAGGAETSPADTLVNYLVVLEGAAPNRRANGEFVVGPVQEGPNDGLDIVAGEFGTLPNERAIEGATDVIVAGATTVSSTGSGLFRILGNASREGELSLGTGSAMSTDDFAALATGDFDEDGILDVVAVREAADIIEIYRSAGGASTIDLGTTDEFSAVVVGDLDADHHLDFAVTRRGAVDQVIIYHGDGNGGFTQSGTASVGDEPASITAADFDQDGDLDLATANEGAGSVSVLLNNGSGGFSPAAGSPIETGTQANRRPTAIVAGDFNGDTIPDLAVANRDSKTVRVLFGQRQ